MENAPRKGMSKGCLVTLIVVGAVIVLVLILLGVCWIYKDDLAKMGANTLVNSLKTELAQHDYEGIDTVQFNTMADAFMERLDEEEPLDYEAYMLFLTSVQQVMEDKTFSIDEVPMVQEAFVQYYPELREFLPPEPEETDLEEDSLTTD